MKNTGIVRRIDDLGRICLPKELRRTIGINELDPLEIYVDGDRIILRKYEAAGSCKVCGKAVQDAIEVSGIPICRPCAEKIAKAHQQQNL